MITDDDDKKCPICLKVGTSRPWVHPSNRLMYITNCRNCGDHLIETSAFSFLNLGQFDEQRPLLAYAVRRVRSEVVIDRAMLDNIVANTRLPSALECIDNVVLYMATIGKPGEEIGLDPNWMQAAIGMEMGAIWAIKQAIDMGYLQTGDARPTSLFLNLAAVQLSAKGWTRYAELRRNGTGSKHAFMAMAFTEPDIRSVYTDHMRHAVKQTDFVLRTTDEAHQAAGSIDDRMRVEIRTSRFIVCDLTHNNRGAYWEAGFAEGIGRPVFYTCRRDVLENTDNAVRPHFDTAHQLIIPWDLDNIGPAMQKLKDAIRATLPAEARMEDPPDALTAG